jgi:hypothetical protein
MQTNLSDLKRAVECRHGGAASFAQSIPVTDSFEGQPGFGGAVTVFDLAGHPEATRAHVRTVEPW